MSLTHAMMSCLLIVSWVIEVEYTLTAIPQLEKHTNKQKSYLLTRKKLTPKQKPPIQGHDPRQNSRR